QKNSTVSKLMSKSAFATSIGVSAPRVSQYIAERKIYGDALVGEGRGALIDPEIARQQLRKAIDITVGNGKHARLDPPVDSTSETAPTRTPSSTATDKVATAIQHERLRELQTRNRRAAEAEYQRRGLLTPTAEANASIHRACARTQAIAEGAIVQIALSLASTFQLPTREVRHAALGAWKAAMETASAAERKAASALPETIPWSPPDSDAQGDQAVEPEDTANAPEEESEDAT
ncbi:MAG: hypothetical protein RIC82_08015, partial [Parvibaculum sp.]